MDAIATPIVIYRLFVTMNEIDFTKNLQILFKSIFFSLYYIIF